MSLRLFNGLSCQDTSEISGRIKPYRSTAQLGHSDMVYRRFITAQLGHSDMVYRRFITVAEQLYCYCVITHSSLSLFNGLSCQDTSEISCIIKPYRSTGQLGHSDMVYRRSITVAVQWEVCVMCWGDIAAGSSRSRHLAKRNGTQYTFPASSVVSIQ
jgi:hypothetical protein